MRHGDNQGNSGLLGPGAVQWMTAGRGIVHSEMPEQKDGLMWGFQLWVNLPAKDKLMKPRYQDIQGDQVPEVDLGPGARARVLVGTVNGVKGPVMEVATDPLYFDLRLEPNASYTATLPEGHNAFVYVYQGDAKIGAAATGIKSQEMALLTRGASLPVTAGEKGARLIVVAGRPLNEPVARYGPFVMNTRGGDPPGVRGLPGGAAVKRSRPFAAVLGRRSASPSATEPSRRNGAGGEAPVEGGLLRAPGLRPGRSAPSEEAVAFFEVT